MEKTKLRGHEIYEKDGVFYYVDNDKPTVTTWESRACGHCELNNTPEGHDGCLGTLPHVINACCGHGNIREAYVQFVGGVTIRGTECLTLFGDARRQNRCR